MNPWYEEYDEEELDVKVELEGWTVSAIASLRLEMRSPVRHPDCQAHHDMPHPAR